jgi:hypothetical protein
MAGSVMPIDRLFPIDVIRCDTCAALAPALSSDDDTSFIALLNEAGSPVMRNTSDAIICCSC